MRTKYQRCRLLASAVLLAAGCSQSVEVTSVYGPGVRFSDTARSYAWAPGSARVSGEGRPENPNVDKLIREFIDTQLALKGYERSLEDGTPDFWIDYAVGKSLRADVNDLTNPMFKEGRLEILALDPATSQMIWKGTAQTRLDDSAPPDENRRRLKLVVRQLIDQVPSARM